MIDAAGNEGASASDSATIDTTAPSATITIDANITDDDIINSYEAQQSVTITGGVGADVKPGDSVTLIVNGNSYSGTVSNSGTFAIAVAGSDLVADIDKIVEASVTTYDAAGNSATAYDTEGYSVDIESPTVSDQAFNYNENQTANTIIATVTASDNVSVNDFKFIHSDGTVSNISEDGYYAIDSSGNISLTQLGAESVVNDYEQSPNSGSYEIAASDTAGNVATATVTLNELNVNDNTPQFDGLNSDSNADSVNDAYSFTYSENSAAGTVIGQVVASDGDGDNIAFTIVKGNENGWFAIDSSTGEITLTPAGAAAVANDFESEPNTHALVVEASDGVNVTSVDVKLVESNINEAPTAIDMVKSVEEDDFGNLNDSNGVYVLNLSDFGFSDVDIADSLQAIKITSLPAAGALYLNGVAVTQDQEIAAVDIENGLLTYEPADRDDSGSDEYIGDTRPDGTTVLPDGFGDQEASYTQFSYAVSDGINWSDNSATMTIDINAVADAPTLTVSATSITASQTIDTSNFTDTTLGFTVTAYNADGTVGTIATNSSPEGFGVAGTASGAYAETGYDDALNAPETIVVTFDNPVDSVNVSFAWNAPQEDIEVAFYNNGVLIDTLRTGGGSDGVDPEINYKPADGSLFDEIRFYPPNSGDDFLINSITYDQTEIRSDGAVIVKELSQTELNISAALTDTDGSEKLAVLLQDIPNGFTISDGTNSFTSDGVTTTVDVTDWDLANLVLTTPEVANDTNYTLKVVATSTEYSNGSTATMVQDIDVTVKAVTTDVAPIISDDQTIHVSEEGLAGGIADTTGTEDTTDVTVVTGQFTVSDANGDTLNVTASVSGNYTSNGEAINWTWDEATQTLTGATASKTVMTVAIDD
ncbi:MAG: Ig-like domain-containing protein, partial [Sulfurovum sp.]|nr:Ig-like domain-containing protein [Sulfurovum sp.]